LYELMVTLKSSTTPLARADLVIVEAVMKLVNSAEQWYEPGISDICLAAARGVTKYLLESAFDLRQLAYVLSPTGKNEARPQLVAMQCTSHLGPMRLPDDEEIARSREPSGELELLEFEDQLATHEKGEEEEIPEGEEQKKRKKKERKERKEKWIGCPFPDYLAPSSRLSQAGGTTLDFAPDLPRPDRGSI
jgi:hypothetical protein